VIQPGDSHLDYHDESYKFIVGLNGYKSFCKIAINRRDTIQAAFDALLGVVDEVFAVDLAATGRSKEIILGRKRLSARDALHLAVMERHGIERILIFDSGFDAFPGIKRLS
jgi:uncharacterized protein